MGSLFDDAPAFHHNHTVGMFDGGEAVGNHQGRAPLHEALQGLLQ